MRKYNIKQTNVSLSIKEFYFLSLKCMKRADVDMWANSPFSVCTKYFINYPREYFIKKLLDTWYAGNNLLVK